MRRDYNLSRIYFISTMSYLDQPSDSLGTPHPTALATRPLTPQQCQLVEKHYPQVRAVVSQMRSYLPTCADLDELHSVGLTGLIAAVRRFNLSQTKTFEAYAAMRIRGAILDELRRLDWMPRAARHRARELRKTVDSLEQNLGRVPTSEETRDQLGLSQADFAKLQERVRPIRFLPLDQPLARDNGAGLMLNLHECIADENTPPTHTHLEHEGNAPRFGAHPGTFVRSPPPSHHALLFSRSAPGGNRRSVQSHRSPHLPDSRPGAAIAPPALGGSELIRGSVRMG